MVKSGPIRFRVLLSHSGFKFIQFLVIRFHVHQILVYFVSDISGFEWVSSQSQGLVFI
uniref:Uncharacterized protein n=1 Tax=Rhizophora mucronata TaxID=61149 RepID=A0A2P2PAP0_RHIMU